MAFIQNTELLFVYHGFCLGTGGDKQVKETQLLMSFGIISAGSLIQGLKMHPQSLLNDLKMKSELLLAIRHNNDHMDFSYSCLVFIGQTKSFELMKNPTPFIQASFFIPGDYQSFHYRLNSL